MPSKDDRSIGWLARAIAAEMYRDLNPFDELKTERILFSGNGVVHPDYGQMSIFNIAGFLMGRLAVSRGAGAGLGFPASRYSAKGCATMGLRVLRSVDYATFELPDGSRPFAHIDMGGHRSRHLMAFVLPQTPGEACDKPKSKL